MSDYSLPGDRASLLADIAEMYYLQELGQAEIARTVGVTRSMVSRMLKEARDKGIVEIRVKRPLRSDYDLENALIERFNLKDALVISAHRNSPVYDLKHLGSAGASVLKRSLKPEMVLGISWGTSVSAVVDALQVDEPVEIKVVQLVGALGARNTTYDGHTLVTQLVEKLGGDGYYMNAPFVCANPAMVRALLKTPGIRESVELGGKSDLALLGIGSISPKYSSYYLAGYVPLEELNRLAQDGAVGDVCGIHFDIQGRYICNDFCERLVTINESDLMNIPLRIGIAGGPGKVEPILGALLSGYINYPVTDDDTARAVLQLASRS